MLAALKTAIRGLLQRPRVEREMDDELRFHLEMEIEAHVSRGLSRAEAERIARRDFGGMMQTREAIRDVRTFSIESAWQDLRHAGRALRAHPGVTVPSAAMLALGIGITTAMFTVVDALILRPVPFHEAEELAQVYMGSETGGRITVSPDVLRAWQASPVLDGAESATPGVAVLEAGDRVVSRGVALVTPGLFEMLGEIAPIRGRLFDATEGRPGTADRVLLSEDLWRSLYQADPAIVGRRIIVDGERLTVVGVLPSDFRFPSSDVVLWKPLSFDARPPERADERPRVFVRFAAGLPRAEALRAMTEAARAVDATTSKLYARDRPLAGLTLDEYQQRAVPMLAGGVVLVFVVLCANVCSLLLAHLTRRRREFSMRAALGASRGRLLRQASFESLLTGVVGLAAGGALAYGLVSVARALLPDAFLLRTLNPLNVDLRALAVTAGVGAAGSVLAGVLPVWMATRIGAGESLRVADRGVTESRSERAIMRGLLVVEIAFACTLLVGATLLVRSFVNLSAADRGIDPRGIVTATVSLPPKQFPDSTARASVARLMEDRLREMSGIQQVAWSYGVPPNGGAFSGGDWRPDNSESPLNNLIVEYYYVGAEFFSLYRIPILRGRTFTSSEPKHSVVIGERLAEIFWPGLDPIGRTFQGIDGAERYSVIGVARELHYPAIETRLDRPEFYLPFTGVGGYAMMSIRCGGPCPDAALIRQRLSRVHPAAQLGDVTRLEDEYLEQLARPRAAAAIGFSFAAVSCVAVAGGLFSVLTYAVSRRRRELAIRAALGASPSQLRRSVLTEGVAVSLAGVAIGAAGAASLGNALSALQYGISAADPASLGTVLVLITATIVIACWRPARQAMRVDPVRALREE
jgi:putative ABC transport system permease protein